LDAAAFVDPTTGAFIYHDIDQGLAVFAFAGTDVNSAITFPSITVDNRYGPFGNPLTSVADQFNAFNNGSPDAGFPTAGFWTASFPTISVAPEPAIWSMLLLGLGAIGWILRSRRSVSVATA
jgi:PEP-CTERM motif